MLAVVERAGSGRTTGYDLKEKGIGGNMAVWSYAGRQFIWMASFLKSFYIVVDVLCMSVYGEVEATWMDASIFCFSLLSTAMRHEGCYGKLLFTEGGLQKRYSRRQNEALVIIKDNQQTKHSKSHYTWRKS